MQELPRAAGETAKTGAPDAASRRDTRTELPRLGLFVRHMVPVDENHVRSFLFSSRHAPGLQAITYRLYYHLWASWSLLKYFIGQEAALQAGNI